MAQITVGVRELKTHLSSYLDQVKAGKTLVITERGKPVGSLIPSAAVIKEKLRQLAKAGIVTWGGKPLRPRKPLMRLRPGEKMASEILLEDRR